MRRVFQRKGLQILCQKCADNAVRTPAEVQDTNIALCWKCYYTEEDKKAKYKQRLAERFNEILGTRRFSDNGDSNDLEEFLEECKEDEKCH